MYTYKNIIQCTVKIYRKDERMLIQRAVSFKKK